MLTLTAWNIDGAFRRVGAQRICKLDDSDLQNFLFKYDIFSLVETHCGPNDTLSLPGYKIFQNIRPKNPKAPHSFGGIAIGIKNDISKGIKIIPATNSEILWIKLCKTFFKLRRDLYISTVYISPASSPFSARRDDIFELLENDLSNYLKLGDCHLCGDFNARTNTDEDYCLDDDLHAVKDFLDYPSDSPIDRNNCDKAPVDKHGEQLLSLCKSSGLRILNGRSLGDYFGRYTCYSYSGQPSTIDYMLSSADLLDNIQCFYVNEPDILSIHCKLSCIIKTGDFNRIQSVDQNVPLQDYVWSAGDDVKFSSALLSSSIQEMITNFTASSSEMSVNEAVDSFNNIMTSTASLMKLKKRPAKSNLKCNNKPKKKKSKAWFDKDCKLYKSKFKSACTKLRLNPYNSSCLQEFRHVRKKYKSLLNKKKDLYSQGLINQLDSLHDHNPQAFWKLFNKLKGDQTKRTSPLSSDDFVNHFKNLVQQNCKLEPNSISYMDQYIMDNKNKIFNELNMRITHDELLKSLRHLERGKACGSDLILNEMLKSGQITILPLLLQLFNKILTNGECPNAWRLNLLTPIHKKGDQHDPANYRGIAVGSHLGKLFCTILNSRLSKFAENKNLLPRAQIGFRKKYRTSDHVLTLKTLIEKYAIGPKKYLFGCFVDFKTAFDTISRTALIYKLLTAGVDGNFLSFIQDMYSNVAYSIKVNGTCSPSFTSNIGVKQGCILSPLLFNLFIRNLPEIFDSGCDPVSLLNIELNCLMFADDLVILSKSYTGMQNCLKKLETFCDKWGLTVNLTKTKIIIFNKGGHLIKKFQFEFKNNCIDVVQSYCYLGITFSASGSFKPACKRLCDQALKAIFKIRQLNIRNNIPTALKLFSTLIVPILTYGSEVWGPYFLKGLKKDNFLNLCDNLPAEKILIRFSKYLLGVKNNATTSAVRGELGLYGLLITSLVQSAKYWLRLGSFDKSSIVYDSYLYSYSIHSNNNWAGYIKKLLVSFDQQEGWNNQGSLYPTKLTRLLKDSLCSKFSEDWCVSIGLSNTDHKDNTKTKLRTYKLFKKDLTLENYLICIRSFKLRREFTKLRTSTHNLHIETGRHCKPKKPVDLRLCHLCDLEAVENEKHFLLDCPFYESERNELFSNTELFSSFKSLNENERFSFLMSCNNGDTEICNLITKFVAACFTKRGN